MAEEMFSWPSLHERMCRTWGTNSGPLACQANSLPIELSRPVRLNTDNEFFVRRDIGMSVSEKTKTESMFSKCFYRCKMSRLMTKPTKWHVRPAKTPISLGIRPVWSESSLSAWRKRGSLATNRVHRPVWSESSLATWGKRGSLATNRAHSQNRSGLADAQADLSLRLAHSHFVGFDMRRLEWRHGWRHSMRCDNCVNRSTNIHK